MVGPLWITHLVWSCRKGGRGGADPFIIATIWGFFLPQAAFGAFSLMKNVYGILFHDSVCLLLLNQAERQVCLLLRKNEWRNGKSEEEENNQSSSPLNSLTVLILQTIADLVRTSLWLIFLVFMLVSLWEFSWAADDPIVLSMMSFESLQLIMIFLSWAWAWRGLCANDRTGRLRAWALTILWTDPAIFELPNAIEYFMSMSSGTRNFLSWWWSSCLEEHDSWEFRELMVIRLSWGAWALRVSRTDDPHVLSKSFGSFVGWWWSGCLREH